MGECIFKTFCGNNSDGKVLSENRDRKRIDSIVVASQRREDTLPETLSPLLDENPNLKVKFHLNCASKYCSTKTLSKTKPPPVKRQRSSEPAFDFKKSCIYCGLDCQVKLNPKHPDRWREALEHYCNERQTNIKYKQYLEEICAARNDKWGETVLLRLAGIPNDVVASDGRYHKHCKRDFFLKFKDLDERSRIWNSVELYNLYTLNNDNVVVDCRTFIKNLLNSFGGALVSFHARGYAKLLCFNDHARGVLKMAKEGDASDDGIENLGRAINAECKEIKFDTDTYDTQIDLEKSMESTSSTLERLLECVSSKFSNSLYSALIGNIVTSIVQNRTTHLQLALGILFRHSKVTLNHLHDYQVTCTHDEGPQI